MTLLKIGNFCYKYFQLLKTFNLQTFNFKNNQNCSKINWTEDIDFMCIEDMFLIARAAAPRTLMNGCSIHWIKNVMQCNYKKCKCIFAFSVFLNYETCCLFFY